MSEGMSTAKKAIIGGCVAGAVLGGAYLLLNGGAKKKEEEQEEAFGTDSHKTPAEVPSVQAVDEDEPVVATTSTPSSTAGSSAPVAVAAKPTGSKFQDINSAYSFKETEQNAGKLDEVVPSTGSPKEFPTEVRDGARHFERLGIVMRLPGDWDCKQEVSPVPTASMITIAKPEFANVPPPQSPDEFGKVPIILLSIEDIAMEGLTPIEYAAKKKMIGMQQLMMMTQGMAQPRVIHEGTVTIGPFHHILEYDIPQGPMQISVMDLFTVVEGFAYCLQIMAKPQVVAYYKAQVMEIAKGIDLYPSPLAVTFTNTACIRVRTGTVESCAPPAWRVMQTKGMLVFNTLSQQKTDAIKICKSSDEPVMDLLAGGTVTRESKLAGGVALTVVKEGSKERKLLQLGNFSVIAEPLKVSTVTTSEDFLLEILECTTECDAEAGTFYESVSRGFRFSIPNPKAIIMESRVGDGAILYSPDGLPEQGPQGPDAGAPAMTIRVEDPSTDSDCMPDLESWFERISSEAGQDPAMQEVKRAVTAGRETVSFVSKEMVEVGPGQREERCAKIVIFMNGDRTHMLRWEASTGNYRRTERHFNTLLETYALL